MPEDLKSRVKELKKRFDDNNGPIFEVELEKLDKATEIPKIESFTDSLFVEIKKSSPEGKYLSSVMESCGDLEPHQIRYVIEKSCDRYEGLLGLMNKYRENFDDDEYNAIASKFLVLNKVLTYMVEQHLGEYHEDEPEQ